MSTESVIEMQHVHKSLGKREVLRGVNMSVPPGQTFAFLGRNGAGKTTTIRTMLGLLPFDCGNIRVLGLDPKNEALEIRRRVGYVAEEQRMFGWMRLKQLISFIAPFYPTWDAALARQLAERFELAMSMRVKHLSKGQAVRVALLLALAHRPELVILDDPTISLDPIMRKEFLRDLVGYLQAEHTTIFFSSHLLYEIEPVADSVVILDRGRVVHQSGTSELRNKVKRILGPAGAMEIFAELPGLLDLSRSGRQVSAVVSDISPARSALLVAGISFGEIDLNLDEIFEAYVIGRKDMPHVQPNMERVA